MHSPSSSGADAPAYYTAQRPDEAGASMDWEASMPARGAEDEGEGRGEGQDVVGQPRGDAVGLGMASESMRFPARVDVNGDYPRSKPSQAVPSSTLANVNNPRRLPPPPSPHDNAYNSLLQWYANEHAHGRAGASNSHETPVHPGFLDPGAASAAHALTQLSQPQEHRRQSGVATPPEDPLARGYPRQQAYNAGPSTQRPRPYGGGTRRASACEYQTPLVLPRNQGHMPQLSMPSYAQRYTMPAIRPTRPLFEASGRRGALDSQHQQLPVHMASSPFHPQSEVRPPPMQHWTVTPHPQQNTAVPVGPSPGPEGGLDKRSARKQEAFKKKAAARKRSSADDSDQTVGRGNTKAPKLGPDAGTCSRQRKSQPIGAPAQQLANAPNIGIPDPVGFQHWAPPYEYNPAHGHRPGYNPALVPQLEQDLAFRSPPMFAPTSQLRCIPGTIPHPYPPEHASLPHPWQAAYQTNNTYSTPFAPKQFEWDLWDQPIVGEYENYKWSVQMYRIDPSETKCKFAQAWLEASIFGMLDNSVKCFAHCTTGFIGGDGDLLSFVVLHNASNPFRMGCTPVSTTTIGVYGLYWNEDKLIHWKTFAPGLRYQLSKAEVDGQIREVRKWGPDMKATEKRFHRAYWMCANLLPLGNLLRQAERPTPVDNGAGNDEDHGFEMTEAEVRNDDLGMEWGDSVAAWGRILEVVERDDAQSRRGGDHQILWSSEWGVDDCARGGIISGD